MPPKKGIVKSGNAGNASKAVTKPPEPEEKPLFPPGSKYPLSLLHERHVLSYEIFRSNSQADLLKVSKEWLGETSR